MFFSFWLDLLRGYWTSEFLIWKIGIFALGLVCWPAHAFDFFGTFILLLVFFVIGWEIAHHYISVIKCILQSIKGY